MPLKLRRKWAIFTDVNKTSIMIFFYILTISFTQVACDWYRVFNNVRVPWMLGNQSYTGGNE